LVTKVWRVSRWLGVGAAAFVIWACNAQPLQRPDPAVVAIQHQTFQQAVNRKLDLIFMIDNSSSMAPLQAQMTKNLPDFMNVLKDQATGGLPDVHIGVISSDLGAGRSLVPGCMRRGGDQGSFQAAGKNPVGCTPPADKYIIDSINPDGSRATNFGAGDITDVFSCIALLGQNGCGFESQFGSVLSAVGPAPPGNEGFLRDDAYLAIVMLTNEDDCTVPSDSDLFDPNMTNPVTDKYGALQSYRCTEFGIKCDQPMPHTSPATPQVLTNCASAEDGRLLKVADFVNQLKASRQDSSKILFAAIAALATKGAGTTASPFEAVRELTVSPSMVGGVPAPILNHVPGCEGYSGDAALRIWDAVTALGGVFQSICQDNYSGAMQVIAQTINKKLLPSCIEGKIASDAAGNAHCHVVDRTFGADGKTYTDVNLEACAANGNVPPCWSLEEGGKCPANSHQLKVNRGGANPSAAVKAVADCEVCVPGSTSASCQ